MFFGGGMFGGADDEFDEFMEFLSTDTKFMRKMCKDMGKGARIRAPGKRGKKTAMGGGDMDDLITMMMMGPGFMGMSASTGSKKKKKKNKAK
jgi:hypothetical protein